MRTTVDLPPSVHRRVRELAAARQQSLSTVVADLTMQALARINVDVAYSRDPVSGLPVLSLGGSVTDEDVAAALDEE